MAFRSLNLSQLKILGGPETGAACICDKRMRGGMANDNICSAVGGEILLEIFVDRLTNLTKGLPEKQEGERKGPLAWPRLKHLLEWWAFQPHLGIFSGSLQATVWAMGSQRERTIDLGTQHTCVK